MKEIHQVCHKCGKKYGEHDCGIATWHWGVCDICDRQGSVTEFRDFGYMRRGYCLLTTPPINHEEGKALEEMIDDIEEASLLPDDYEVASKLNRVLTKKLKEYEKDHK